jgi:hypothetical protein
MGTNLSAATLKTVTTLGPALVAAIAPFRTGAGRVRQLLSRLHRGCRRREHCLDDLDGVI